MITRLLCSRNLEHLSDQQRMFLLRAAYGPTLTFRPRSTPWLAALLEQGLMREHAQKKVDYPLLYLTVPGFDKAKLILSAEDARRTLECAARDSVRESERQHDA